MCYSVCSSVFFFILILVCSACVSALRSVRVSVPQAVRAGHSVTLACDYDLEQEPLYSVKWYRGDEEFYRFVPKEEPPTRVFDLPGINVDVSVSNAREVTLLRVGRPISGRYLCEVSADAPLFHTAIQSAMMTVVELPDGMPTVTVDRMRFAQGGPLVADCRAPPSSPAANLTWFVNDQRVPGSTATSVDKSSDGLQTASSRLELSGVGSTTPGPVKLRCVASLFKIYRVSSVEVEVRPDSPPKPASVLDNSINSSPKQFRFHDCYIPFMFIINAVVSQTTNSRIVLMVTSLMFINYQLLLKLVQQLS